jgi:hypothetical protein
MSHPLRGTPGITESRELIVDFKSHPAPRLRFTALILSMASLGDDTVHEVNASNQFGSRLNHPRRTVMKLYNQQHQFYCGIELHAKMLLACVVN